MKCLPYTALEAHKREAELALVPAARYLNFHVSTALRTEKTHLLLGGRPSAAFYPESMANFLCYLQVALPGLEKDKYMQVLRYLHEKGVSSAADVDKITEEELADILGGKAARALMECIRAMVATGLRRQQGCTVGPTTQPLPFGNAVSTLNVCRGPDHGNSGAVASSPVVGTEIVANVENGATMNDLLQTVLAVQQMEAERTRNLILYEANKTREMVKAMITIQEQNLQAMQQQMTETAGCFSATLGTMTKQMSQQAERHRQTVNLMSKQMTNSNRIHADTLSQMQSAMQAKSKRYAATLRMMNSTMARTAAQHEETVRRLQARLASKK